MLSVDVDFVNRNTQSLSMISGEVVAFQGDNIVGVSSFTKEDVEVNGHFSINSQFVSNNSSAVLDYDKLSVFFNFIAGEV